MRYFQLPLTAIFCFPVVLIAGCSQNNSPSQAAIKESLQEKLPSYSEVESFQIEKSENLGTKTEPKIQARFRASLRISEDLYDTAASDDFNLSRRPLASDIKFLTKVTDKGKKLKVYGLSVSEQYADTWSTDFKFEENPFSSLGTPRRQFREKTIVKGSAEEKKYKQEREKVTQKFRSDTASTLFSQEHKGYLRQGYRQHPFTLSFTSYDKDSGNLEGTVSFKGFSIRPTEVVKRIQGKFANSKISFATTGFVSGKEKDTWGLGTEYLIDMNEQFPRQSSLSGSWNHPGKLNGKSNGELTIQLN